MSRPMDLPADPASSSMVVVETMPQLLNAHNPTEDWTGVTSAAVRRKLQNRLNQRAHRQCSTTVLYDRSLLRPLS